MYTDILEVQLNKLYQASNINYNFSLCLLIQSIYNNGIDGQQRLLEFLKQRQNNKHSNISWIDGEIFEALLKSSLLPITHNLKKNFPNGIVPLNSELHMNYRPLQQLLINKNFREANTLTQQQLQKLSQKLINHSRTWLYFSDIYKLPVQDLKTIDQLWTIYSHRSFGFSVQKNIWISNNNDWDQFLHKIGWTTNHNLYRRYPEEFIWNQNAPNGHLPLFNQIRGNQVLKALFNHDIWKEYSIYS